MTRQTFRIKGMHCANCAMAIDMEVEDMPGVKEARTSFARSTTEVTYDASQIEASRLVAAIQALGYEAELISK